MHRHYHHRLLTLLLAAASAIAGAQPAAPEGPSGWAPKQPVSGRRAMIATANPLATDAGFRILAQGGSAVDAAVAAQLVLNLVEPQSSGIGGGAFIVHHQGRTGKLAAYDGRETAPAAATPERFLGKDGKPLTFADAVVGGRSVGVPGTLRVLELAHAKHGRLPWASLFAPAIELAERGFPLSARLHGALGNEKALVRDAAARAYFYQGDGKPHPVGHLLRNPEFAATLRQIATGGADAFYRGDIARDIVAKVRAHPVNPGDMTEADLAGYQAKERAPVCGPYRAYKVCGMPLPSSGGMTVLQMLGMLERFDLSRLEPGSLFAAHLFAEAGALAYADRGRYMADPDFVPPPPGLLDGDYLHARAWLIRPGQALGRAQPGDPQTAPRQRKVAWADDASLEFPSTSHLSIVDRYGNALAMTTTIEDIFGSRQMVRGFLLNNELTDFSFAPSEGGKPVANRVEAGKRPRSSMAPTIVFDRAGRVHAVLGSPGGSAIINYVAKALVGMLDWKLDPQRAIDLPNMGSRNFGYVELEKDTAAAALEPKLRALGHDVRVISHTSGLQAIARTARGWTGGADPRREGTVRGD
ncbi:MAG: gamma-glutamyltransferase [Betaproteobacteria bacterium]|nr:gamma-glutamyltransferase [Betaproteobacteria bacterium]